MHQLFHRAQRRLVRSVVPKQYLALCSARMLRLLALRLLVPVFLCACRVEFAALQYSQPLSMRRLDYLVGSVRRSFGDSINQLIDYLGVKVVYSDLRDILLDGLYLPTVQDCRIDDAIPPLIARLRSLDALLTEPVVRDVHDGAYRQTETTGNAHAACRPALLCSRLTQRCSR